MFRNTVAQRTGHPILGSVTQVLLECNVLMF
jgi:hypothetical protein